LWGRASQILFYLEVFESQSERKRGKSTSSIRDLSHWDSKPRDGPEICRPLCANYRELTEMGRGCLASFDPLCS
jgi:hypothetical protein